MRFRRHMRPDIASGPPVEEPGEPQPKRRSVLRDVLLVLLVAVVGFLVAALWLSPVSLFAHDDAVPLLIGSGLSDAEAQLAGLGYRVRVAPAVESPEIERGKIMRQDPPAGTFAPRSTVVIVTPSAGQMPVAVPDLVGLEMSQAIKVLGAAGLKPGAIDSVIDRQEDGGVVLGTRPSAGAGRMPGSTVDLIINGANQ
ncbi:MAG TPA: PASTA domain-containing protein [Gemmatimonadales bacterium]|nr:PASTA domain-containing protein [Gemmatimonadales bacterium]